MGNTSPAENIKPESWISHVQSLGKIDNKFKDNALQLNQLVQNLESQPIYNNRDQIIKVEEIYKAISKLKNNKAVGLDSVSNEMLKAAQISFELTFAETF